MKSKTLRALVLAGLLLPSCSPLVHDPAAGRSFPTLLPLLPDRPSVHFAILGDMGTGGSGQFQVAEVLSARARSDAFDFVLTVGDNFYPSGVSSAQDDQWQTKFEEVYADPALQVPFYPTLGNHDHKGDASAQIAYSEHSDRWTMPAPFFAFEKILDDGTRVAFFAIDTTALGEAGPKSDAQLRWLENALAAAQNARWRIVYGHHPIYSHSKTRRNVLLQERLEPLLASAAVDVYLAGHDHVLEMHKPIQGVHYVISGGGAGPEKAYFVDWTEESYYAATLGGFVTGRASRDQLIFEFVRMDGATQYRHVLSARAPRAVQEP